jgi:hypothetical protein
MTALVVRLKNEPVRVQAEGVRELAQQLGFVDLVKLLTRR